MNSDLCATLDELGPGYREFVDRLRRPFDEPVNRCTLSAVVPRGGPGKTVADDRRTEKQRWIPLLAAAVFALTLGVFAVLTPQLRTDGGVSSPTRIYTVAYGGVSATQEIIATQKADGSWENDFITRQNAAALRGVEGASVAYRKAVRYLRSRGLVPLSDSELQSRALLAAAKR